MDLLAVDGEEGWVTVMCKKDTGEASPSPELEFTAFHEAGHAVASVRFGFNPYHVTIVPHEDSLGFSGNLDGWEDEGEEEAANYIVLLLAGYVASIRVTPEWESRARLGSASDFGKAEEILEYLGEQVDDASWNRWLARATEWISNSKNWRAIEEVATELLEYSTLDYDEVRMIVETADDPSGLEALGRLVEYRVYRMPHPRIRIPSTPGETVEGRNFELTVEEGGGFLLRRK
jgi:ATP-dependent Zn protease